MNRDFDQVLQHLVLTVMVKNCHLYKQILALQLSFHLQPDIFLLELQAAKYILFAYQINMIGLNIMKFQRETIERIGNILFTYNKGWLHPHTKNTGSYRVRFYQLFDGIV